MAVQKPTKTGNATNFTPFTEKRALELFQDYRDADLADEEAIGPEGLERLCAESQMEMDGAKPIVLAWLLGSKEMGRFTKEEWSKGTMAWKIDTLQKIALAVNDVHEVLFGKPVNPKGGTGTADDNIPYHKQLYRTYANDPTAAFRKFYNFTFDLARSDQARNVDMEIATALWSAILAPKYPICTDLIEFIQEKKTYKGVNKDVWSMSMEFCGEFNRDTLDTYESDGAWPTMIDDFVNSQLTRPKETVNNEEHS